MFVRIVAHSTHNDEKVVVCQPALELNPKQLLGTRNWQIDVSATINTVPELERLIETLQNARGTLNRGALSNFEIKNNPHG